MFTSIRSLRVVLVCLSMMLGGCASIYRTAPEGAAAATITETGERRGIAWYQSFTLVEVDDQTVSHAGKSVATVRVPPGKRKLLITVRFLHSSFGESLLKSMHGGDGECPCQAVFPIVMDLSDGDSLRIDGAVSPEAKVSMWLTDTRTGEPVTAEMTQRARALERTQTIYVPVTYK